MNKFKRSARLFKTAFTILFREKKLLLFPFIASGFAFVAALFFITPIVLYPTGHPYFSTAHWSALGERFSQSFSPPPHSLNHPFLNSFTAGHVLFQHWWITLFFAISYFTSMFISIFCNVAFYHEIMQALNGNAVSIQRGFAFAKTRWRAVLMWSLFAGLVGYIIRAIEQRAGFLGRIIAGLIGVTWSIACIFIIPTLVRDTQTVNPLVLLRHSAGTLKRTWGELVIGFVGLEVVAFFVIIPFVMIMVFIMAGASHSMMTPQHHVTLALLMFPLMFLVLLPISWLTNLVNSIYRCALFIYATEGVIPESFDKELLDSAWKVK
ncbi:MAG TPA: DUF6159 family protein [Verrucomicrobiae bacterium]|jgi:hypothetical protein